MSVLFLRKMKKVQFTDSQHLKQLVLGGKKEKVGKCFPTGFTKKKKSASKVQFLPEKGADR